MNDLRQKADPPPAPNAEPLDGLALDSLHNLVRHVDIDEDSAGQRLDNLLIRILKGVPRSHVYQLVRTGQVRINGKRAEVLQRLNIDDRVRIPPVRVAQVSPRRAPPSEFPIVFEDAELLVINKPAGVAVHGGSGVSSGVIEQLRSARPDQRFLELVHRIDRDTSGLLMIAKKRACLVRLQAQLRERSAEKTYLAVVKGRWPKRTKTLRSTLETYVSGDGERRVAVAEGGQTATTHVLGLESFELPLAGVCSLVSCRIETGRMHQIRVHLAHAGFPIIGDQKYGEFDVNKALHKLSFKRMYLHAFSLEIEHETEPLRLQAPMPDDFARLIASTAAASAAP